MIERVSLVAVSRFDRLLYVAYHFIKQKCSSRFLTVKACFLLKHIFLRHYANIDNHYYTKTARLSQSSFLLSVLCLRIIYIFSLILRECPKGKKAVIVNNRYECPDHPPCGEHPNCVVGRKGPGCSQPDVQPCSGEVSFEICHNQY